ncbi:MAG: serine/threonine protein kinase, partial [Verrucomicrobia bacterium]|nr:serine/threonine protein kinase [Verrucomicrobiota bacterium]
MILARVALILPRRLEDNHDGTHRPDHRRLRDCGVVGRWRHGGGVSGAPNRARPLRRTQDHRAAGRQRPEYVARFLHEAKAAAKLNHPNIVAVHSAGSDQGVHYLIQELVEGESLDRRLDREGAMDPQEALAVCVLVAEGLKYAWDEARLIHRDVKPANIFLSIKGTVKLGDLGLAKSVGAATNTLTVTGTPMGSPHYMSPEQAKGDKDVDFRTDIYGLGCTLFHMLSGRTPYDANEPMALMLKHVSEPPPDILQAKPDCPPRAAALVKRMMAKDPNERFASYDELIAELMAAHDQIKQASAEQLAPAVTARKPKTLLICGGAAAALAVIAIAVLFVWSPWRKGEAVPRSAGVPPSTTEGATNIAAQVPPSPSAAAVPAELPTTSTGVDDAWIKAVAALPAEEQVKRVVA